MRKACRLRAAAVANGVGPGTGAGDALRRKGGRSSYADCGGLPDHCGGTCDGCIEREDGVAP